MVYNQAEAGMSGISHTQPFDAAGDNLANWYNGDEASLKTVDLDGDAVGWEDRIGVVETYSDLEYSQLDLTVGGVYDFTERLYTACSLTYSDFDSDEEYVFGDESGESYYGYVGVGYRF